MEAILCDLGVRFERQPDIQGHPDFHIAGARVLLFCDSSFWHGRRDRDRSGASFGRNQAFWSGKLIANRLRDQRTNRRLRRAGWTVLRFWDSDIFKNPDGVKKRVERFVHAVR